MTIRRQYSLPNCTLILDGLSNGNPSTGFADAKPLMSVLVNAECHFADRDRPLSGGGEFFQSLTTAVNRYAQEFLSGVAHPQTAKESGMVTINRIERGEHDRVHRLSSLEIGDRDLVPVGKKDPIASIPRTEIDLSTVQLFDLVEAIDRFLADNSTLPDIVAPISASPAAFSRPLSRQIAPAGLGIAGLAAAALACYVVPAPNKISEPKVITLPPATTKTVPVPTQPGGTTPQAIPVSPSPSNPQTVPPSPQGTSQPPSPTTPRTTPVNSPNPNR
jgi:hypothetical protein